VKSPTQSEPSIFQGHVAEIEAFGKSPDKRVHRFFRDSAFRGSWRQEVRDTSYRRNREERSQPSVCWDTWQQSSKSGKAPKGSTPSENRRSGIRGVRNTRHQNSRNPESRNPDSRYPDMILTVRSSTDLDR
jgi:hypothetical protein